MKQDKKHIDHLLPQYLNDTLDKAERAKVVAHLKDCGPCQEELRQLEILFHAFGQEEKITPTEQLRNRFLQQLEEEKQATSQVFQLQNPSKKKTSWAGHFLKIAASIALLMGSFFMGKHFQAEKSSKDIAALEHETLEMKQTAMLSLMENRSASKRIQGVNFVEEFKVPDEAIIQALIDRMAHDENNNVRRTAVDALARFTVSETVKNAFIRQLKTEKDAGIQIAIIQILVGIQEKKAVQSMQYLLNKKDTPIFVKKEIETLLPKII